MRKLPERKVLWKVRTTLCPVVEVFRPLSLPLIPALRTRVAARAPQASHLARNARGESTALSLAPKSPPSVPLPARCANLASSRGSQRVPLAPSAAQDITPMLVLHHAQRAQKSVVVQVVV